MGIQADYVRKIQGLLATAESLAEQERRGGRRLRGQGPRSAAEVQHRPAMLGDAAGEQPRAIVDRTWVMPGAYGRRKVNWLTWWPSTRAAPATSPGATTRRATGSRSSASRPTWSGRDLFFSLCHQAEAALRHAEKGPYEHGRSFTTAFLEGFTAEVRRRLRSRQGSAGRGGPGSTSTPPPAAPGAASPSSWPTRPNGWRPNWRPSRPAHLVAPVGRTVVLGVRAGPAAGRNASLTRGSVPNGGARCSTGDASGAPVRRLRQRGRRPCRGRAHPSGTSARSGA